MVIVGRQLSSLRKQESLRIKSSSNAVQEKTFPMMEGRV